MSARLTTITAVALALVTSTLILAPSQALPAEVRFAVLHASLGLEGLPTNVDAEHISTDKIKESHLKDFDALLLDSATFSDAWSDSAKQNALKKFAKAHRVLLIEGDADVFDPFTDLDLPRGGDVAYDADGNPLPALGKARAIYRTHGGKWDTAAFEYDSKDLYKARIAKDVAEWINAREDFQADHGQPLTAQATDNANWVWRATTSYSYTWSPYGKLGYTAEVFYASNDGTTAYRWWDVEMSQSMEPGKSLWGNNWRTYQSWVTGDVQYYNPSNQLVDWNPYSSVDATAGTVTMNGAIGLVAGVEGAPLTSEMSTGYSAQLMYVAQSSTTGTDDVYVRHDFNYGAAPTAGLWTNQPAWTLRANEADCFKMPWTNKVQWREYTGTGTDNFQTNWISSWREYC